jgi:hypothetical protein
MTDKKPGFWQRLFGLGKPEPAKKEPPAPKPAKKEPPSQEPAQKEPPERRRAPKKTKHLATTVFRCGLVKSSFGSAKLPVASVVL